MLAIKQTPNILLIGVCVSSFFQQDICYVKVCVLKNWKGLFLSKLILYLLGKEHGLYSFLFLTYIFTRYLRNIHKKKILNPQGYPREKFGPTKYTREKISEPRNTHEKKMWDPRNTHEKNYGLTKAQWHDGTRPAIPTVVRDPRNLAHS